MNRETWSARLHEEAAYWDHVMATKGGDYPEDFRARLDPNTELQPEIRALLPGRARILDVGAGPFTIIGKRWPGRQVFIKAIDPLAVVYSGQLARHGIMPPVWTEMGEGERLAGEYERDSFDLAYSRNALDHSHDPVTAIRGMLHVAPIVLLSHAVREATTQQHQGLHQWDFFVEEHRFLVEGGGVVTDIGAATGAHLKIDTDGRWLTVTLRR